MGRKKKNLEFCRKRMVKIAEELNLPEEERIIINGYFKD